MNKEIGTTLITGFAVLFTVLVAIWMTWADTNERIASLDTRVSTQLIDLNTRAGRIEGALIAQGQLPSSADAIPSPETAN